MLGMSGNENLLRIVSALPAWISCLRTAPPAAICVLSPSLWASSLMVGLAILVCGCFLL